MSDYIKKSVLLKVIADIQPDASEYECAHDNRKITIEDVENNAYWAARDMFDDVMVVIEGATPADVAPVVHGRWKYEYERHGVFFGICSVCDHTCQVNNYCGRCGAKMDEIIEGDNAE